MKKLRLSLLLTLFLFALVFMWSAKAEAADYDDITDGNWNSDATWSGTGIPGINDNVIIDSHTVTLAAATQNVHDITISAGGTLNGVSGNTLTVSGDWDSTGGTFNANSSIVEIGTNGNSNTIKTDPAASFIFYSLTINAGSNISVDPLDTNGFRVDGIFTISGTFDIPLGIGVTSRWANSLIINTGGELTGQGTYTRDVDDTTVHIVNNGTILIDTFIYRVRTWSGPQPITATTYGNDLVIKNLGSDSWDSYIGCATEPSCPDDLVVPGNFYLFDDRTSIWFPAGVTITLDNSTYDIPVTVNGDLIIGMDPNTHTCESISYPPGPACGCGFFITGNSTINVGGDLRIYDNQPPVAASDCDSQIVATDGTPTINITGDLIIGDAADNGGAVFDSGASTISVGGNWDSSNGTFTAGTSTVAFNGIVAQGITSGGDSLYNLTISNTSDTVSLADDASLLTNGTLTINANATLDLNGNNLTVPTTFNNNGTLQLEGGETVSTPTNNSGSLVKYDGTAGPYTLKNWTYGSLQLSSLSATTYNMPGPLTLNSSLTIDANNTLDTNNNNLNVGGDWTNNGTFTAGTGTVTLNGTGTQGVTTGSSLFNTLEITNSTSDVTFLDNLTATNFTSNTPSVAMRFNAWSTYIITNLTLNGAEGNRITLRSTVPGTQWNLNVSGTQSLSYVDVSDSDASGGNQIICTTGCIGLSENNDNWVGLLVAIPTMTEWGIIIFMVLAGFLSIYNLKKRRAL